MYRQFNRAEGATGCGPAFDKRQFKGQHRFHPYMESMRKAPVSIYKTDTSYEVLIFAPGRNKENFSVSIKGSEIIVTYTPTEDTASLEWIRKEYSRGGFERSFGIDDTMDVTNIVAKYEDGVLKLSLPIIPGSEKEKQEIVIN